MCLIVDKPCGVSIPSDLVETAYRNNGDGWGVMSPKRGGGIAIHRGFRLDKLKKVLGKLAEDSTCTVHFRWATHGTVSVENTHPFEFQGGRYSLMHNGIIGDVPIRDDKRSDTWHFTHDILSPILRDNPDYFDDGQRFAGAVGRIVGAGNKLVILRDDGAKLTVNHNQGTEWEGLWLSNTHSLPGRSKWSRYLRDKYDWDNTGYLGERWVRESDGSYRPVPERDYTTAGRSIHDESPDRYDYGGGRSRESLAPWSLEDFARSSFDEMKDAMRRNPDYVASLIEEYFG